MLITARIGRIGTTLLNRGDRLATSNRGSLYNPFIACLSKKVERLIAGRHRNWILRDFPYQLLTGSCPALLTVCTDYNTLPHGRLAP